MSRVITVLLAAVGLCGPVLAGEDAPLGFFASSVEAQSRAESVLLETPSPERARQWLMELTEKPHVAGTPQEKIVAEYVRQRLEEFGLETEVVTYEVHLNYPKHVAARLVQPEELELELQEEEIDTDR